MKYKLLLKILIVLCLNSTYAQSEVDLKSASSNDIMAEIMFLKSILPQPPKKNRLGNSDENAFLNFLSSYAICEGWDFEEYIDFVGIYEREIQKFVPSGRTLNIKLSERSYYARAENGCQVSAPAELAVEDFFGETRAYYLGWKKRDQIQRAINARINEMHERTLGLSE